MYEAGEAPSSGGRPPQTLAFNRDAGVVLVADLGATHSRLAIANLSGDVLGERADDLDIARGPDEVMAHVLDRFDELWSSPGVTPATCAASAWGCRARWSTRWGVR